MKDRKLTRLITATLAFMVLCFIGSAYYSYHTAQKRAMEDAITNAQINVEKAQDIINSHLVEIETLSNHISQNEPVGTPQEMCEKFKHFLEQDPLVQGFCIAFEKGKMEGYDDFMPLVERHEGRIVATNVYDVNPTSCSEDWYAETKRQDKVRWGNVMRDANGPLIVCHCTPLHDKDGGFIGVMTVSLRLDTFTDILSEKIHPYEHSRLYVIDRTEHYLIHPNHDYILHETLTSAMQKRGVQPVKGEGVPAESGHITLRDPDGNRSMLYFIPIEKAGWKLAIESTEEDIYAASRRMGRNMILTGLIFIVLFILGCIYIYRRVVKVIRERSSIETELNTARNIQMAMVPKIFPAYPNRKEMDVHAMLSPAKAVGGDLYDFYLVGDHLMFCIGDVSGKGVPASLFMAITRSLFRNIAYHVQSPAEVAKTLNKAIAENNEQNMFVTMFIGSCNLRTGEFACCNCGHNAPVTNADVIDPKTMTIGAGDQMRFMSHVPTNIPIGVIEDFPYQEVRMNLTKGVVLYLYTDGVTEAENPSKELYGDEHLIEVCQSFDKDASAKEVVENIHESVLRFANGQEQSDDITLLCFQYLVDPEKS